MDVSDIPDPPRRRSFSYYFVLIFLVAPVWSSVPLAWFGLLYNICQPKWSIWSSLMSAVCITEALFCVYHFYLKRSVSGPSPCSAGNLGEIQTAFERILKCGLSEVTVDEESLEIRRPSSPNETITQLEEDDPRAIHFRNTLRTLFGRVPWNSVRLHEVRQWLYWSIFGLPLPREDRMPCSHVELMDHTVDLLQKRLGRAIPEGSTNGKVKPALVTIDRLNVSWRPFSFYAIVSGINWLLKQRYLRTFNMKFGSRGNFEYLIRIPVTWDPKDGPSPLILIHGLGLGLLQYAVIIDDLLKSFPDRPLLVPLQPHISQDIFHTRFLKPMSRHQTIDSLINLMLDLKWIERHPELPEKDLAPIPPPFRSIGLGPTILSHSNGSYFHAWILKGHANLVHRSCFVDPVAFGSWEGDVCYNFLYKQCTTGMELLMRYFVGTELGVANLLQRHFDWSSNSLWFEEIPEACDPSKNLFCLGGRDGILCAQSIKRYLTSHGVHENLLLDPAARHGRALIAGSPGYRRIFQWLRE